MGDITDRAERAQRLVRIIEAGVAVRLAGIALVEAVRAMEAALGGAHDATETIREAARQCRVAGVKAEIAKQRTPWP